MKVKELIEKLQACDPEAEVGHAIPDATGYVSAVSFIGVASEAGRTAIVLCTGKHEETLFPDEVDIAAL